MSKRRLLLKEHQLDVDKQKVYSFDCSSAASNPDATTGGSISISFDSSHIDTLNIGDSLKMLISGYLDTRNAINLISSISWGSATSGSVGLSTQGYNFSNNSVGFFTIEQFVVRTSSDGYKVSNRFSIRTNIDNFIQNTGSTNIAGATSGLVSPQINVVFAEADIENKLNLISWTVEIFKATH